MNPHFFFTFRTTAWTTLSTPNAVESVRCLFDLHPRSSSNSSALCNVMVSNLYLFYHSCFAPPPSSLTSRSDNYDWRDNRLHASFVLTLRNIKCTFVSDNLTACVPKMTLWICVHRGDYIFITCLSFWSSFLDVKNAPTQHIFFPLSIQDTLVNSRSSMIIALVKLSSNSTVISTKRVSSLRASTSNTLKSSPGSTCCYLLEVLDSSSSCVYPVFSFFIDGNPWTCGNSFFLL